MTNTRPMRTKRTKCLERKHVSWVSRKLVNVLYRQRKRDFSAYFIWLKSIDIVANDALLALRPCCAKKTIAARLSKGSGSSISLQPIEISHFHKIGGHIFLAKLKYSSSGE